MPVEPPLFDPVPDRTWASESTQDIERRFFNEGLADGVSVKPSLFDPVPDRTVWASQSSQDIEPRFFNEAQNHSPANPSLFDPVPDRTLMGESANESALAGASEPSMRTHPVEKGRTISISEITDVSAFREIRDDWAGLLESCQQGTPFLSWEWLFTWWDVFATNSNWLKIVTIRENGRLIGLAPFQIENRGLMQGGVTLRFIGTGEDEADEVVSEYLDILAQSGAEAKVTESLISWFAGQEDWRRVLFENILPDSMVDKFCDAIGNRYCQTAQSTGFKYDIPLSGGYELYLKGIGKSRSKRLAQSERRLQKDGGQSLRSSCTSLAEIESAFDVLARLNHERWDSKSKPCIFDSKKFTEFHRKIIGLLWSSGKSDILTLHLGNTPLAAIYCFYDKKGVYYYQSGFASEGANRYTPLWVAHSRLIEMAAASGYQTYDFMRGDEDSYKSEFGCRATPMRTRLVFRSTLETRVFALKLRIRQGFKDFSKKLST